MEEAILAFSILAAFGTVLSFFIFNYNKCLREKENVLAWAESVKDFVIQCHAANSGFEQYDSRVIETQLRVLELKIPYVKENSFHLGGTTLASVVDSIAGDFRIMMDENKGKGAGIPLTAQGISHDSTRTLETDITRFINDLLKTRCRFI